MSISFNWDFEEEEPDPSDPYEGMTTPSAPRRRHWLSLGMTLLTLLVMGGLGARTWVGNRLRTIKRVEEQLRDLVELELQNIADGDQELFRSRQDPTVFRWRERQIARYISISGGFGPAPGLTPADRPPEIEQVRVVGRTGRVEMTQWFQPVRPADPVNQPNPSLADWFQSPLPAEAVSSTTPLPFHVTWFYRLDKDGVWYHTAPPKSHTGVAYSWHGARLAVHATEIEAEALNPIAGDLTALILDGCRLLGCGKEDHYTLSFDDTPVPQVHDNRWNLPAPYLAGIPANQAAHDAWQHSLKLWLAEALAQSRSGDRVTDRVLYHHLVTRLQTELRLAEPLEPNVERLAQAMTAGERHLLQDLWEAQYVPDDPEGNRLLDAEAAALLQWLESQIGVRRLFEPLPVLHDYRRLDNALYVIYRLAPLDLEIEWSTYLFELTGRPPLPPAALQAPYRALTPPPILPRSRVPPSDQIALICNNRVWVSDADGSNLAPLTTANEHFNSLYWSPDGRWLLTAWWHGSEGSALYLLAADGNKGRLLTDNPLLYVFPIGWSPDGSQAIYYVYRDPAGGQGEVWATDVDSGETRQLPDVPRWSPDGQYLVYEAASSNALGSAVWLADADWENARQIAERAELGSGEPWSPDGSRLALTLLNDDPTQNAIALYDVATESITPLITIADLTESVLSSALADHEDGNSNFVIDMADPAALDKRPLQSLWSLDWSADGSRLVVLAQATTGLLNITAPAVLAVAPLDGSAPQVLAFGNGGLDGNTTWSPTNPDQLTFAWPTRPRLSGIAAHLYDLNAGSLYTATQNWRTAWSPDGAWVALAGQGPVTVIDQAGRSHFAPGRDGSCSAVAWNPTSDLSALGQPIAITLASPQDDWRFSNVHVYQDQFNRSLRAWGQVTHHTGGEQRIVGLIPVVHDASGAASETGHPITFPPSHKELVQSVSLADGRSLPFDFSIHLFGQTQLEDDSEIVVQVAAVPTAPTRDDLDVLTDTLELSGEPGALFARGTWENPGPDLEEYVVAVVTVYGDEGQVLGWGWRDETSFAHLASGKHNFAVQVALSTTVIDLDQISSYKVQLFAH